MAEACGRPPRENSAPLGVALLLQSMHKAAGPHLSASSPRMHSPPHVSMGIDYSCGE